MEEERNDQLPDLETILEKVCAFSVLCKEANTNIGVFIHLLSAQNRTKELLVDVNGGCDKGVRRKGRT